MKSLIYFLSIAASSLGVLCLAVTNSLAANRFLPDPQPMAIPDFSKPATLINTYGQPMPTTFDQDVNSSIGKCGNIKFDYSTYSVNPKGDIQGGTALAGGFFLDSKRCMTLNGFDLHWVQTVTATETGANNWMLPSMNAGEFPDAKITSPVYANESVLTSPPGMTPTLGFQDFPARNFADGTQSWLAELGLVAISQTPNIEMEMDGVKMMFREVRVLDTFLWGFNFNNPTAPFSVASVTANAPSFFGNPTQSYLDTLNNFYDGLGGGDPNAMPPVPGKASTKYKFFSNNNVFKLVPQNTIPEPSSIFGLFAIAGFGLSRIRQKR